MINSLHRKVKHVLNVCNHKKGAFVISITLSNSIKIFKKNNHAHKTL